MGKIGKLFKDSTVAVLKWMKAAVLKIETPTPISSFDIVIIDEMWHFVNGKKEDLDLEILDDLSRQSPGWELGHRGDSCAKRLILSRPLKRPLLKRAPVVRTYKSSPLSVLPQAEAGPPAGTQKIGSQV